MTGNQSAKAYEEGMRFFNPSLANDYTKVLNENSEGKTGSFSQNDIKYDPNDAFLFYVDEEPREGIALNFTPNGNLYTVTEMKDQLTLSLHSKCFRFASRIKN